MNTNDFPHLVCEICSGKNIETKAWIDPNDNVVLDVISGDPDDNWCRDCKKHVNLIYEKSK